MRPRDMAMGAGGGGLALLIAAALMGAGLAPVTHAFLIAPMGATAVILFALPNSPLAQPWSAVVGNTLSALVACALHMVTQDPVLMVAGSTLLALLAMFLARALHPPGGAVALTAALSPDVLEGIGFWFVLGPVFAGTLLLVALAMIWHHLCGRVYPFRQPAEDATADRPAAQRLGLSPEELASILADFRQSANVGVEDLARLIAAAEQVAAGHALGTTTAGAIMSRDLVTVTPDTRAAQVAALFRKYGFTSIPVVQDDDTLMGVIFQLDLIRRARRPALRGREPLGAVLARLGRERDSGLLRAREVMSTTLPTVSEETPAADLIAMLADGGPDAVPVMRGPRIMGIVTRTDLLSSLARGIARGTPG